MNLFFGLDLRKKNIKIMRSDKAIENAEIDYLPFTEKPLSEQFFAQAQQLLQGYFSEKPLKQNATAFVVLPNEYVGFETFNLPNTGALKMWQSLEAELTNLYAGRQKDKKINKFVIAKNKQYTTIGAHYYDKAMLGDIYKLLSEFKAVPKDTTFSANSLINGVYELQPKLRGKNFLFADMHEDYTEIVVSCKGRPMGYATIPHGTALLDSGKVEQEYMITDHYAGELAVINARETARARALTTAEIEDEELVRLSEAAAEENEALSDGEDEFTDAEGREENQAPAEAVAADSVTFTDAAAGSDGATVAEGFADVVKPNKIKVFRKTLRRYPRFMLRDVPETVEGIAFENFRIIAKWLLLYARSAELSEYAASPEQILVNLPEDKRFLLDKMNEEQGDGLQFNAFTAGDKLPEHVRGNMNLFGCRYSRERGQFGKDE